MKTLKSQSILEYLIIVSAIVVAVIAAAQNIIPRTVGNMFNDTSALISSSTAQLKDHLSHRPQNQ